MSLQSRLRPWHGLMATVFVLGAGSSLLRADAFTLRSAMLATVTGLFGVVVFQFTVGTAWASAVEYRNAGGRWTDLAFVAPFGVGLVAAAASLSVAPRPTLAAVASALWAGVVVFAVAMAVTSLVVQILVGYRDSQPAR